MRPGSVVADGKPDAEGTVEEAEEGISHSVKAALMDAEDAGEAVFHQVVTCLCVKYVTRADAQLVCVVTAMMSSPILHHPEELV